MYVLNLAEDRRILSVTLDKFMPGKQPLVKELPEGDITDYKYINSEYVYDPLPKPEPPAPQPTINERLDILENAILDIADIIGGEN